MKRRLGIWLHGTALKLNPDIALALTIAIRQQTIDELAAQHRQRIAKRAARQ